MLYLLDKDVRTVRWNGEPLHEATSAIVKETMNGDFTLTVKYPISDSGFYQLIKEDMLIKAPTPVLGAQLFRIKKPVEHNDHLEITAYHISDDVMQRSITPVSVTNQSCSMALSRMVQNTKTALGDFSFNSDIQDRRTFNTTETETLYSVLLDGKHSIVGTWEGELVRDNFAMTVKKSRGENRGVVITTHKNLKDYQRTRNSQNVVTRIHAKSTFKPEGAKTETTIRATVDSPLINSYPYINEKEYENNNAKTVEELQKWAQSKFSNEGIDKVSDAIKIEAYELDGQVVHMGDTVNLKSWKHNVDAFKKAIAYEFDALKEEYISLTFDNKARTGGSRASGGLSSAADAILGVTGTAQEIALEKALQNADLDFDHKAGLLRQEISDGIELAKAKAEEVKKSLTETIDQRFSNFDNGPLQEVKRRSEEALRNAGASSSLAQEAKLISEQVRRQLDNKADLVEFQRVKETNQLYERIIGSSESDIAEKVARMTLTNQLFQVEVGKYTNVGGPNMLRNSRADDGLKYWTEANGRLSFTAHSYYFNGQKRMFELRPGAVVKSPRFIVKRNTDYTLNILGFDNNSKYFRVYISKRVKGYVSDFQQRLLIFNGQPQWVDGPVFDNMKAVKKSITFNVGEFDECYLQFEYDRNNPNKWGGLFMTELDFYEGTTDRRWQPAPEDATLETDKTLEATQTKMTQLAGSWAVQNINSAGDIISGINLGSNGQNRISGKATHITGETLIDNAVIKSAMIDKLKTANFEAGSVTTTILDAEAVTADKLRVDQAFFNKLVANEAYLSQLFAKQAFINRVKSITIDASQVQSGVLSGDRIYGGTITGSNIYGGTLTGHTKIQLGSYGSFDTTNGGLQINVPRSHNTKDGLGVQFIGSYGRGEDVPYGLFIYKDSDFTTGGYASDSDEFLLTVRGYIKAKGIGWLKTGNGRIDGGTTGTIGLWNSDNVYLSFGGSSNDIYYSYNSTAYSLWSVINKHFSDRRLKDNIVDCKHKALDYIHQFQFKEYDWKKQEDRPQQAHTKIGLIAQEVQAVDPTLVYENGDTLNLDNLRLTNIALKAIQELALENKKLTQRLENLENERRTA
ncbi:phage tail spike protein [uncultured Streptococcus sp.]|uniref:phage tail spike protein n=1 Tax=uncultured Streptococcus sp. TaxID=83427 RepID=UPI0028E46487|nr:phage tail spike protein [uncultured Streptococcus sp.]